MEGTEARVPGPDQGRVALPGSDGLRRKGALLEAIQDGGDPSRKRFLKMVGGAGAAGAFAVLLSACGDDEEEEDTTAAQETTAGDQDAEEVLDVFNYALTLEFLEAKFYRDVIDSGVIEDEMVAQVAQTFGGHEQEHVDALSAAIEQMGGTPAQDPNGNFQSVIDGGPEMVLTVAARVENVGAGAYLAEAPKLISSDEALAAALSIHTVEARHAAALNAAAGLDFTGGDQFEGSIPDGAFATPADRDTVMKEIQPFLAGGGGN